MNTFSIYAEFFKDALKEVKNNFTIYSIYMIGLCLVSITQHALDYYYGFQDPTLKIFSKVLFSVVPLLILSKIIYVIKIRRTGNGDFIKLLSYFLIFNFLYFMFLFLSLTLYIVPATIFSTYFKSSIGYLATSFLLIPFIYILIFYSLTPFVAALEEEEKVNFFSSSKTLTMKNILLVVSNHIFSLAAPLLTSLLLLIKNPGLKLGVAAVVSVPEALLSIILTLTTARIYYYLTDLD